MDTAGLQTCSRVPPQSSTDIYVVLLMAACGWNDDRVDQSTVSHDVERLRKIRNLYRHPAGGDANGYCFIQERPPHRAETTRDIEKPIAQTQRMQVLAYTSLGGMGDSGAEERDVNRRSLPTMHIIDVIGPDCKSTPWVALRGAATNQLVRAILFFST